MNIRRSLLCNSLAVIFFITTFDSTVAIAATEEQPTVELTKERALEIERQLDQLAVSDKITDLPLFKKLQKEIHDHLGSKIDDSNGPAEVNKQLSMRTRLFFQLFKSLDARIIPDIKLETYHLTVLPPSGSNIIPGMSPSSIKDPIMRKKYEMDIQKNRAVLVINSFHQGVLRCRFMSNRYLVAFFRHYYRSEQGRKDFEAILEDVVDDKKLRAQILEKIEPKDL